MKKHENKILLAVVFSEISHVFCCVLPIVFSALSLLAGAGVISAMPTGLVWVHDVMHHYEVLMIALSGLILALGWGVYFYAKKIDCHDTGCHHEPCGTKKKVANKILIFASILFVVNVSVYVFSHSGLVHLF